MACGWYAKFEGVCTNGKCPYVADICPVEEHQEVCIYRDAQDVHDCTTCAYEHISSRLPPCYTCDRAYDSVPSGWEKAVIAYD